MFFAKTPRPPKNQHADSCSSRTTATLTKLLTPAWRKMTISLLRKLLTALCMAVLCLSSGAVAKPADDDFNAQAAGFFRSLRKKYEALPESGKFATGACIGFGGSRLAVKSAVSVVKIAGAAFVTTEVLNAAGLLDDIPSFSEEQIELAESLKRRALTIANDFRSSVRKRINPEKISSFMATDRSAALGALSGALVGFML